MAANLFYLCTNPEIRAGIGFTFRKRMPSKNGNRKCSCSFFATAKGETGCLLCAVPFINYAVFIHYLIVRIVRNFVNKKSFHSFVAMTVQERILEKAEELFKKHGIKSVTMDDIAVRLGISKKTIYQLFTDKNELVSQIFNQHILQSRDDCFKAYEGAQNAVHEVLIGLETFYETMQNINPNIMYDLEKYHPDVFAKIIEFKNKFLHTIIVKNLKRGIEEELYRSDINIEIITRLRLATLLLGMNIEVFPVHKFKLADTEREIVTHFLSGIVTPKGARMMKKYLARIADKHSVLN